MDDINEIDFTNYTGETIEKRKEKIDQGMLSEGAPGYTSALINSVRGFRMVGRGPAMMPLSDNTIGLAFVTRPQLNLTDDAIRRSERLVNLYGVSPNSAGGIIRGWLDERWAAAHQPVGVQNKLPFIPMLTTFLKTSTGFGDLQLQIKSSDPGMRDQVYQRVDSKLEENGIFTISQSYWNPRPSLIPALFQTWCDYISEVVSGDREVPPRDKYLFGNRIDFDCRIYHLQMNKDTEFLEQIFATVQSIPVSFPIGSQSNIDNTGNSLRSEGQDDFNMQFSSQGMRFNEFGLIQSFNEHSYRYNPAIRPENRNRYYRMLAPNEYEAYASRAYPILVPVINERFKDNGPSRSGIKLSWWVEK